MLALKKGPFPSHPAVCFKIHCERCFELGVYLSNRPKWREPQKKVAGYTTCLTITVLPSENHSARQSTQRQSVEKRRCASNKYSEKQASNSLVHTPMIVKLGITFFLITFSVCLNAHAFLLVKNWKSISSAHQMNDWIHPYSYQNMSRFFLRFMLLKML